MINDFGKWLHSAYAATSMAFFLSVIDKIELLSSSEWLVSSTISFAVSLFSNSILSFVYYISNVDDLEHIVRKNWFTKGFNNLANWSFIFAVGSLVWFILKETISLSNFF